MMAQRGLGAKGMQDHVAVSVADGVQTIRFDRPEKNNALDAEMHEAAADALSIAERDSRIRTVLFAGMPGIFATGHDPDDIRRFVREAAFGASALRFMKTLATLDKPVVAAVDGLAVGIGTVLLFHCDYVVASEWSVFSAPFADWGVTPEGAASLLAPRLMGHHRAFELLVLGESFDAQRATVAGLVNRVATAADVEDVAFAAAKSLAAKPPEAVRAARRLMLGERREVNTRIDQEAAAFVELLRSPAARDALDAYLDKDAG